MCWLAEGENVVAEGDEREGNFHVLYPLDSGDQRGDIIPISKNYVPMTFHIRTKVTWSDSLPIQNKEEIDQKEDANHNVDEDDEQGGQADTVKRVVKETKSAKEGGESNEDKGGSGEEVDQRNEDTLKMKARKANTDLLQVNTAIKKGCPSLIKKQQQMLILIDTLHINEKCSCLIF